MNCPRCQAKLLPVDGEMFCLQCGNMVAGKQSAAEPGPAMEDTTDPILQKAIEDSVGHKVPFRLPVSEAPAPAPKTAAFASMRSVLAPPRSAMVPATAGTATVATAAAMPADTGDGDRGLVQRVVAPTPPPEAESAPPAAVPASPAKTATAETAETKPEPPPPPPAAEPAAVPTPPPQPPVATSVPGPPGPKIKTKVAAINLLPAKVAGHLRWNGELPIAWTVAAVVVVALGLTSYALGQYYSSRVFPGVNVGSMQLGGVELSAIRQKLQAVAPTPELAVAVGGVKQPLATQDFAEADVERLEREVRAAGRSAPLPLIGMVQSLTSVPLKWNYQIDSAKLDEAIANLAAGFNYKASNAVPMIVKGKAFVIHDSTGSQLNAAKSAVLIRQSLGRDETVTLPVDVLKPLVTADALKSNVEEAQARLALKLSIKVKSSTHTPSVEQIGAWLVFAAPGKGVLVDGPKVSEYIKSLAGKFDRAAATTALVAALKDKQDLTHAAGTASTKAPALAAVTRKVPAVTYRYCVKGANANVETAVTDRAKAVLGSADGWNLGAQLKFARESGDCHFTIKVLEAAEMAKAGADCGDRTTCQAGNQLVINAANWNAAPKAWSGGQETYRNELINHLVGQWLGFTHASCTGQKVEVPVLDEPTLVLGGCSSKWYPVAIEALGTKTPPAF